MARRERYVVGLDVGTSRATAVVGESMDDGTLDIVGLGTSESRGIKRGVVVNVLNDQNAQRAHTMFPGASLTSDQNAPSCRTACVNSLYLSGFTT